MEDAVIRPNKKLCTCLRCQQQTPRGKSMLHIDRWGSRCTICLPCVIELGLKAKEVMTNESVR